MIAMKMDIDSDNLFAHFAAKLPGTKRHPFVLQASGIETSKLWKEICDICFSRDMDGEKACFVVDAYTQQYTVIQQELQRLADGIAKAKSDVIADRLRKSLPVVFVVVGSDTDVYDVMQLGYLRRLITGKQLQGELLCMKASVNKLEQTIVQSVAPVDASEADLAAFLNQHSTWLMEQLLASKTACFAQQQVGMELRVWLAHKGATTNVKQADPCRSHLQTLIHIYNRQLQHNTTYYGSRDVVPSATAADTLPPLSLTKDSVGGFPLKQIIPKKRSVATTPTFVSTAAMAVDESLSLWDSQESLDAGVMNLFNTAPDLSNVFNKKRAVYDACMFYDQINANVSQRRGSEDPYLLLLEAAYVVSHCVHRKQDSNSVSNAYFKSLDHCASHRTWQSNMQNKIQERNANRIRIHSQENTEEDAKKGRIDQWCFYY